MPRDNRTAKTRPRSNSSAARSAPATVADRKGGANRALKSPPRVQRAGRFSWREGVILAALVAGVLIAFGQCLGHEFLLYDDTLYVTRNDRVRQGLTLDNLRWACTAVVAANWHPLTLLSHMLDCQLFGLSWPGGHLATNLVFHAANAVLVFLMLRRLTARVWPAALAAALFAWHPLRAESVAWVAERKDVLSTFFWCLALWAYGRYAERPSIIRYALVAIPFALGLASKAMVVTLPCVLLLLDFWPLERVGRSDFQGGAGWSKLRRIIGEKLPLFALSAAASLVTVWAQQSVGMVRSVALLSLPMRAMNALVSYVAYLGGTIWPANLAALYPLPDRQLEPLWVAAAAITILAISAAAVGWRRRRPYWFVGWFWYLGTLVPVIGLVQVGDQAMADRYTYIPSIGLCIAVAWGLADWSNVPLWRRYAASVGAACVLLALLIVTHRQVSLWRDTITLFRHTLALTGSNHTAHFTLGTALLEQFRDENRNAGGHPTRHMLDEAIRQFDAAIALRPNYHMVYHNKAFALRMEGRLDEAAAAALKAIQTGYAGADAQTNAAEILLLLGSHEAARRHYALALRLNARYPAAVFGMGLALSKLGEFDSAFDYFQRAMENQPRSPWVADKLARILATHPDAARRDSRRALQLAEHACRLTGLAYAPALDTLSAAYAEAGQFDRAVEAGEAALRVASQHATHDPAMRALAGAIRERMDLYRQQQPYREDPADATIWLAN